MAAAIAGEAVSMTASGKLTRIENAKPSITVLSVAMVSPNTVGPMAIVSVQI